MLFHFTFLIDRSGSMQTNRMRKAKESLILFLRSLPPGLRYSIISFGSNSSSLEINGNTVIEHSEENAKLAISQIESFSSNMGGTDISTPLKMVIN